MEELNKFEKEIVDRFANKYHFLKNHIPYLAVSDRQFTGVGIYINFTYTIDVKELPILESSLSTDETINMLGLENGLICELDISKGKMNFIELVTIGENWDGSISVYSFEKN